MARREEWESDARKREDALLKRYRRDVGEPAGIFVEVGISRKRLDAVRVTPAPHKGIRKGRRGEFKKAIDQADSVELIEVKSRLSEAVIGQCLVGTALFSGRYSVPIERTVALCKACYDVH